MPHDPHVTYANVELGKDLVTGGGCECARVRVRGLCALLNFLSRRARARNFRAYRGEAVGPKTKYKANAMRSALRAQSSEGALVFVHCTAVLVAPRMPFERAICGAPYACTLRASRLPPRSTRCCPCLQQQPQPPLARGLRGSALPLISCPTTSLVLVEFGCTEICLRRMLCCSHPVAVKTGKDPALRQKYQAQRTSRPLHRY